MQKLKSAANDVPPRVANVKEAWQRLRHNGYFWLLVALFSLIPITRILGI